MARLRVSVPRRHWRSRRRRPRAPRARNPQNILARVVANHIPAYLIGGEFDIFQNGEPVNYAELQNAWDGRSTTAPMVSGQRTTGRYQLIVGPWEHLNGSSVDVDPLELEWFDTWLKHERTGMARTPTPLHYYDLGSGQFDETSTYPFTGASPTRLYFGAGGTLTGSAPTAPGGADAGSAGGAGGIGGVGGTLAGSGSAVNGVLGTVAGSGSPLSGVLGTVTGSAPSPVTTSDTLVWSPSGAPCGRPIDQWSMGGISVPAATAGLLAPCVSDDQLAQAGPWRISHTSTPLAHAETIAGPVTATVYASSTTAQTELVAELEDVTPSGASYPLTEGGAASPAGWRCLHDRALSDGSVVAHGRDAQVASSEPGSAGTSTAYCSSRSSGTRSSARSWVAARTTKAATPPSCARSHAWVVTHQRSPG